MIKTKKIYPKGFYILESNVAANSNYIEHLSEAKLLLNLLQKYTAGFLKIHDYLITRHGIQLAVRLKSEANIQKAFQYVSIERNNQELDSSRIISERIRLCLSSYVRTINYRRGRTGVLVHSNFNKYYFENLSEAKLHLENMREQLVCMYQRKKKYRGKKKHYTIQHEISKGSIFLCSKELKMQTKSLRKTQTLRDFTNIVLPKLIKRTKSIHFNQKKHTQNTKQTQNSS